MNKLILNITLLLILASCSEFPQEKPNIDDLEYEVIRSTIDDLVPLKPADLTIVHPSSENEEVNKFRYDSVITVNQKIVDSLGLEIWLLDELFVPDSVILQVMLDALGENELLSFSGVESKEIDEIEFENNSKLRIMLKESFEKMNVNTVGILQYSRILFSAEMDTAKFIYNFNSGNCTDGWFGVATSTFENDQWRIIKNKH